MQSGQTVEQGAWAYRLAQPAAGCWQLLEQEAGQWVGRYAVGLERQHHSDIVVANHYASTSPSSPFVRQPVVVRKDDHAVRRLLGRQLSLVRPSGVVSERLVGDAELDHVLSELGSDVPTHVRDAVRRWRAR